MRDLTIQATAICLGPREEEVNKGMLRAVVPLGLSLALVLAGTDERRDAIFPGGVPPRCILGRLKFPFTAIEINLQSKTISRSEHGALQRFICLSNGRSTSNSNSNAKSDSCTRQPYSGHGPGLKGVLS